MDPNACCKGHNVQSESVEIRSGEYKLQGTHFRPKRGDPTAVIVLNGAAGVPASYYEPFAHWLCETKRFSCLIYDYRDFNISSCDHARRSRATMSDWGVHDQNAARAFTCSLYPDVPLWVIGHSLGAMCLPFQKNLDQIDRVIAVASGIVNVSDHPWPYQALARFFWFGPVPLATWLMRFMPGKALRLGSNLPRGVYWQWRRWCTRRDFYARDFGRELPFPDWLAIKAPAKFVAVSDDVMTPPSTVWRLMQCFPEAPKTQTTLRPEDFDLIELGHIGVFAEKSKAVWEEIVT